MKNNKGKKIKEKQKNKKTKQKTKRVKNKKAKILLPARWKSSGTGKCRQQK